MTLKKTGSRRAGGFTLVEILVVMSIISILAGLALSGVMSGRTSGEEGAVKYNITARVSAIEAYATETGDYPPSSLAAYGIRGGKQFKVQAGEGIILVGAKRDSETGGYFKPTEYQIWSLGVDEVNDEYGDGDDICHWQR